MKAHHAHELHEQESTRHPHWPAHIGGWFSTMLNPYHPTGMRKPLPPRFKPWSLWKPWQQRLLYCAIALAAGLVIVLYTHFFDADVGRFLNNSD